MRKMIVALGMVLVVSGCATPTVVQTQQVSDYNLNCSQLDQAMAETDRYKQDASKEKGMTGTNVAAAILFWPAIVGTYMNSNEAIAAADNRRNHLMGIYREKKCIK